MPEDNFEALSNADLRAKCKEFGLPNVPVTDSSRPVLIRKLRAVSSVGGAAAAARSGTPTKKTNRRETIHVLKTHSTTTEENVSANAAAKVQSDNVVQRSINRAHNRRTIGATPSFDNEIITTTTREQYKEHPVAEVTAAPVSIRRRSVREQIAEKIAQSGERRETVIIESDEEDELVLAAAIEAEQMNMPRRQTSRPASRSERANSLSKTGVVTTSYAKDLYASPIIEERQIVAEKVVEDAPRSDKANIMDTYGILQSNIHKRATETLVLTRPSYTQPVRSSTDLPRYITQTQTQSIPLSSSTSYYTQNLRRSVPAVGITATSSAYSKPYYNEQSDDGDANTGETFDTPYLSSFARNLERVKTEPLGGRSHGFFGSAGSSSSGVNDDITRRYKRHTMYESSGRRYRPANQSSPLLELWSELNAKYQLKRYFVILLIILLVVLLYVLISP